ncbi:MAG TPA: OmpA family protein [Acidobacteriota bacterium]|nr:OmpA family protein [Acidobacteriota bacterium]HNR38487.1 OmpA family protein [Acidobacteriota bacterium]HNT99392.1 OmpA family protein [Acidobacteriota bacterium]HPB28062.1 OmpA family protein [Acidobacteriota bacterium]HQO25752.1 OmpA family protein [Acidobacteriota bacterium]
MKLPMRSVFGLLVLGLFTASFYAADVQLTTTVYPEKREVKVPFQATDRAPVAEVKAKVKGAAGQITVEMEYKNLVPAILFGGDITTYVVWAITPAGEVENLGQVATSDKNGSSRFATAKKDFALVITAEPLAPVSNPSDILIFYSGAPAPKDAKSRTFAFAGLVDKSELFTCKNKSIRGMSYSNTTPVTLLQAQKAVELAERFKTDLVLPEAVKSAKSALAQATNLLTEKGAGNKAGQDSARRAVEFASQALKEHFRIVEEKAAAALEAKRQAEKAALAQQATDADTARRKTEVSLQQSETARKQAEEAQRRAEASIAESKRELAKLDQERARLKAERDALANRLSGALAMVSATTETARGYVVSLSDITFDTGKATLKTDAKYSLAKLAGILTLLQEMTLSVEGHTDSTGSAETNQKLSAARANSVMTFLKEMGVAETRMTAKGFGPDQPVAPNDTAEGRARNRRVEIILPKTQ